MSDPGDVTDAEAGFAMHRSAPLGIHIVVLGLCIHPYTQLTYPGGGGGCTKASFVTPGVVMYAGWGEARAQGRNYQLADSTGLGCKLYTYKYPSVFISVLLRIDRLNV